MKVIIFIIIMICGACSGIREWRKNEIQKELERGEKVGYSAGYSAGYSEIEKVFAPKLEDQRSLYKQKLQKQKNLYEKKIASAKKDGLYNGKKDKLNEIDKSIQDNAKTLQEKGKWDSVLFEVK